jgi:hypothetical protein
VFSDANPLFEHAEMQLWVTAQNGLDVGRIAGIVDRNFNAYQKENAAFFGFFECINDRAVAHALMEQVVNWARSKGFNKILGPLNPTTNEEGGLLVNGFDSSPVFMMTYNPPYYADLVAGEGFTKAKDLLAYFFDLANTPMGRFERIAAKFKKRELDIAIVPIRRTDDRGRRSGADGNSRSCSLRWCHVPTGTSGKRSVVIASAPRHGRQLEIATMSPRNPSRDGQTHFRPLLWFQTLLLCRTSCRAVQGRTGDMTTPPSPAARRT